MPDEITQLNESNELNINERPTVPSGQIPTHSYDVHTSTGVTRVVQVVDELLLSTRPSIQHENLGPLLSLLDKTIK